MRVIAAAALVAGVLVYAAPQHADAALLLGTNLVVNGDAETPSNPGGGATAITGWTSTAGGMTVVPYGTSGGFPATTDPGPSNRGAQFFAGGEGFALSSLTQNLSVADGAALIDAGAVTFTLSAFLGGYDGQDDSAGFSVTFESATNTSLGTVALSGPNSTGRGGVTGLLATSIASSVPAGTRSLLFELDSVRFQGSYDDGYADNLSFIATASTPTQAVPEPVSLAILGSSLIGVLAFKRRRP